MDAHVESFTGWRSLPARNSGYATYSKGAFYKNRGHSLQELLVTLGLVSLLLATSYPELRPLGQNSEPRLFTLAVTQALSRARNLAIASGERVTFCGSPDGETCAANWYEPVQLLVFRDRDDNHAVSAGDTVHLARTLELAQGKALSRLSGGRPYLRYRANGSAMEFGRFTYCPQDGLPEGFRQLVINRVGRVYQHHDDSGRREHCD